MRPEAAYYDTTLHEFLLPYTAMRASPSPDQMLLDFFESTTYAAAADLASWDRGSLERHD